MPYAFVPIVLLVVIALIWTWWSSRDDRDPASSVDSFNRALTAMQPGSPSAKGTRRPGSDQPSEAADPQPPAGDGGVGNASDRPVETTRVDDDHDEAVDSEAW